MEKNNKVLIVEDDKLLQDGYALALDAQDFKVLRAGNGKEGLEIALKEKPDLILLDILMPVMDGLEMLEKLRQDEKYGKNVPVFLLTNLSPNNKEISIKVAETNPLYYIMKSGITFTEVVDKIKEVLK